MVINITLGLVAGFVTLDRVKSDRADPGRVAPDAACGFVCTALVGAACANAVDPAVRVITTANEKAENQRAENQRSDESGERKVERRPNMRLLWRRLLLLRAPRLLVCFGRESLGGQSLG
jgi:hypothetical protein